MDMNEFTYWRAYCLLEPFGGDTDFLRTGILAATLANINRKKGSKAMKPRDFMPDFKKRFLSGVKQSPSTIKSFMMGLVKSTAKRKDK